MLAARSARVAAAGSRLSSYLAKKSVVPTMHYQRSMPRLPIPKLEDTCERYLYNVKALVDEEAFKATEALVHDFRDGGNGAELHAALVARDKANPASSFISEPWFDMYLENRDPVLINVNPQITLNDDPVPARNTQAYRTAALISSSLKFKRSLDESVLAPDIFPTKPHLSESGWFENAVRFVPQSVSWYAAYLVGAYPLDMSQYKNLFCSNRVPLAGKDALEVHREARHVVIQRGPDFYSLPVLHEDGKTALSQAEILGQVEWVLAQPRGDAARPHVGALTTQGRDEWAAARARLVGSGEANAAALREVESALFTITLEDAAPETDEDCCRLMLHGDGRARWMDKSFNLVVAGNGKTAINFEHAWGDGVAVMRYVNEVFDDTLASELVPAAAEPALAPRKVEFDLPPECEADVRAAEQRAAAHIASLTIRVNQSAAMNRKSIKASGLGPDGVQQMSLQLAFFRQHGFTPATYESASTSGFRAGRTETIRPATPEAAAFVQVFMDERSSPEARREALKVAVDNHGRITKDALMGQGVDRHLFAMMDLAKRGGLPVHDMFAADPTYALYHRNLLSTSTLASHAISVGGFGPVVDPAVDSRALGVGYGITDEYLGTVISSYDAGNLDEFQQSLDQALKEINDVLVL